MFCDYKFSPEVARILTQLTTYKGRLPQGSPTSSTNANLVFVKTGKNLDLFVRKYNYLKLPENFIKKLRDTTSYTKEQIKGLFLYKLKVDRINRKNS
jgi:hypothetical protein